MASSEKQPDAPMELPEPGASASSAEKQASVRAKRTQPEMGQRLHMVIPTKVLADAVIRALCAPEVVKLYTDSLAHALREQLRGTEEWDAAEMTAKIMERIERKEFAEDVAQQIITSAVEFKKQVAKGEKGGNDEKRSE
jgi:hypothetical protein